MNNYKMKIEYDGSRYDGWQRIGNDESSNTISSKIIEIIKKMSNQEIELICGCRTEKGVHAYAQIANFKMNSIMKAHEVQNYLNRYLPRDIAVLEVEQVNDRFQSQLNAKSKTYVYRIDTKNIANVFERKYMYHAFNKLDLDAMKKGAKHFLGKHDYKTFSTAKKSKSTVRTVETVEIYDAGEEVEIRITADDFLHNMARLMVGILLEIGSGKRQPEEVLDVLEGKNNAVLSAPAESSGLFLQSILY